MRKLLAVIFCVLIASCSGIERSPKPDPFFNTEKMATIMTDVYLIEGAMSTNRKSFVSLGIIPDSYIYEKHKIDSISFKNNFNYYADRVEDFIEVLDIVDENLLVIKDSINAREERIKQTLPKLDPIKNKTKDSLRSYINAYSDDDK